MNFKYLFLIGIVSLTQQCASWKKNLTSEGGEGGAIENAILDFSNSSRQFKEFNTFHILKVSSEKVIGLSILGDSNKWRLGAIRIGNTNKYFPSRFKEINGKLFYWSDSTTVITKDVLEVMKKYKVLDTVQYPNNIIPDDTGTYSNTTTDYYFCRSNTLKYKKLTSKVAIGHYWPPNLSCD